MLEQEIISREELEIETQRLRDELRGKLERLYRSDSADIQTQTVRSPSSARRNNNSEASQLRLHQYRHLDHLYKHPHHPRAPNHFLKKTIGLPMNLFPNPFHIFHDPQCQDQLLPLLYPLLLLHLSRGLILVWSDHHLVYRLLLDLPTLGISLVPPPLVRLHLSPDPPRAPIYGHNHLLESSAPLRPRIEVSSYCMSSRRNSKRQIPNSKREFLSEMYRVQCHFKLSSGPLYPPLQPVP
jgi:hypothetical protein